MKSMPTPVGRGRERSFTLIELLVVIAIIGILMALLFPALKSAKESANGISCVSKQRQLYLAISSYRGDYGGYLPPNDKTSGGTYDTEWICPTLQYLGKGYDYAHSGGYLPATSAEVLHCPGNPGAALSSYRWWSSDYGVNASGNLFGGDGSPNRPAESFPAPCTPSTLMFIMDSDNRAVSWNSWTASSVGSNFMRHKGGSELVYFDGHSGYLPLRGLIQAVSVSSDLVAFFAWK